MRFGLSRLPECPERSHPNVRTSALTRSQALSPELPGAYTCQPLGCVDHPVKLSQRSIGACKQPRSSRDAAETFPPSFSTLTTPFAVHKIRGLVRGEINADLSSSGQHRKWGGVGRCPRLLPTTRAQLTGNATNTMPGSRPFQHGSGPKRNERNYKRIAMWGSAKLCAHGSF